MPGLQVVTLYCCCLFCSFIFNSVLLEQLPTAGNPPDCFTKLEGICIENDFECPFVGGEKRDYPSRMNKHMCPEKMSCCVPPKSTSRHNYSSLTPHCGIVNYDERNKPSMRIIGGYKASLKQFPWQASIMCRNKHLCGGTLIHPSWVLTAAHCKTKNRCSDHDIQVIVGQVSLTNGVNGQVRSIKRFVSHHMFVHHYRDVAVLELTSPVTLNEFTNIACLPHPKEKFDNMVCVTSGFGSIDNGKRDTSDALMFIPVPTVPIETCKKVWKESDDYEIDGILQRCAGDKSGKKDTCSGDSGGPLICRKIDGSGKERFVLAGVTSFGERTCGKSNSYTVYANAVEMLGWIQFAMQIFFYQ